MLNTYEQQAKAKLIGTIAAVLVVAGIVVFADHIRSKDNDANAVSTAQTSTANDTHVTNSSTTSDNQAVSGSNTAATLKDGTYTDSEDYFVPPGQESVAVTATIQNGVVSDISITNSKNDRESAEFQNDFAGSYKSQVVGQKISGLQIRAIAGASDTTDAFNRALSQITTKAQA
jgi:uncharacterized protein with FMN-binding domain